MIHPLKIFFIKLKHIGIHKLFGQSFEGDTKRKHPVFKCSEKMKDCLKR